MLDSTSQLAAAQLALYAVLIIPTTYSLYKHGRRGIEGWFFLFAFCSLRIIGSGLQLSDEKSGSTNRTAQTIGGVGLSPLVLSIAGVVHEAYVILQFQRILFYALEIPLIKDRTYFVCPLVIPISRDRFLSH
jgi:hypothetical protein